MFMKKVFFLFFNFHLFIEISYLSRCDDDDADERRPIIKTGDKVNRGLIIPVFYMVSFRFTLLLF